MRTTWLRTSTPASRRSARARAPAATRAVVSRALALSTHVAQVVGSVLEGAGEIGVARARVAKPAALAGGVGLGVG